MRKLVLAWFLRQVIFICQKFVGKIPQKLFKIGH